MYLRKLDEGRRPSLEELLSLNLFDRVEPRDFGRLIPVGRDEFGNDVYVLGCGRNREIVIRTLKGFSRLLGDNPDDFLLADVYPLINWVMRVGGFASRVLRLVALGRPVVAAGTLLAYPRLAGLARETRRRVEAYRQGAGAR